jgi:hypothetical protein
MIVKSKEEADKINGFKFPELRFIKEALSLNETLSLNLEVNQMKKFIAIEQNMDDECFGDVFITEIEAKDAETAVDEYCDMNCGSVVFMSKENFINMCESYSNKKNGE